MVVDDYWTQILLNEVHTPWQCTIGVPKALILCIHDMDNSFLGCRYFTSGDVKCTWRQIGAAALRRLT
jgi:hypothetical protein